MMGMEGEVGVAYTDWGAFVFSYVLVCRYRDEREYGTF